MARQKKLGIVNNVVQCYLSHQWMKGCRLEVKGACIPGHCVVLRTDMPSLQGTPLKELGVTVHNRCSQPVHLIHRMLSHCR